MSCSKEGDNQFAFLSFLSTKYNIQDMGAIEKCICSIDEDEMIPSDGISEVRHRGEVAIDIGFRNMGISTEEKRTLIRQWTTELGKDVTDWLSHDIRQGV